MKLDGFDRDAPAIAHAKLDRLWLIREEDGAATISTEVRDPDNNQVRYYLTMSLARVQS